jgi:hypothetical protein
MSVGKLGEVTKEGGPEFVPCAERIAAFDNGGTPLGQAAWRAGRPYFFSATCPSRLLRNSR